MLQTGHRTIMEPTGFHEFTYLKGALLNRPSAERSVHIGDRRSLSLNAPGPHCRRAEQR
jgi:hypothetical protein